VITHRKTHAAVRRSPLLHSAILAGAAIKLATPF
jgi:hypothetical protein